MVGPSEMRVSDGDREAAAQLLNTAMAQGRITIAELEERLDAVYSASTYADLEPPLADLPGAAAITAREPASAAQAERMHLSTDLGSTVKRLSAIKRNGDWVVPAAMRLSTTMGLIHLDFTEARSVPPQVDIEVEIGSGRVTLVLPPGATADVLGVSGKVSSRVPAFPSTTGPHLTITGRVKTGDVGGLLTVRGPRTGWSKALFST